MLSAHFVCAEIQKPMLIGIDHEEFLSFLDDEVSRCEETGKEIDIEIADNNQYTFAVGGVPYCVPEGTPIDADFISRLGIDMPVLSGRYPGWYFYAIFRPRTVN